MDGWQIWIIVSLLLFIIEIFTSGFALICIAIGAIFAAVASVCGCQFVVQIVFFSIGSLISALTVRPLLLKYFHRDNHQVKTNTDALIGRTAIVSEKIDDLKNTGRVRIDGDDWKAVSEDDSVIDVGTKVQVAKIDSVVLTVKKNIKS